MSFRPLPILLTDRARTDSAVLGVSSVIKAFPYEVPPFIPAILIESMSKHAASPVPLSTTVRATLADFKRTHADSWETDQKAFTPEQLADLQDLLTGSVRFRPSPNFDRIKIR